MTNSLNPKRYAIIVLTVITALIHFALSFNPLNPLFLLTARRESAGDRERQNVNRFTLLGARLIIDRQPKEIL